MPQANAAAGSTSSLAVKAFLCHPEPPLETVKQTPLEPTKVTTTTEESMSQVELEDPRSMLHTITEESMSQVELGDPKSMLESMPEGRDEGRDCCAAGKTTLLGSAAEEQMNCSQRRKGRRDCEAHVVAAA